MAERRRVSKMTVSVEKPYKRANIRDDNNNVIGTIENATMVELLEDYNKKSERTKIKGKDAKGKAITGTILTSCLK